jgi:Carboxypeptidase regulatory-like domain
MGPLGGWPAGFAVFDEGIFYLPAADSTQQGSIQFLSFSSGRSWPVLVTDRPIRGGGLSVSSDRRFVVFDHEDQIGSDLMLVENFVAPCSVQPTLKRIAKNAKISRLAIRRIGLPAFCESPRGFPGKNPWLTERRYFMSMSKEFLCLRLMLISCLVSGLWDMSVDSSLLGIVMHETGAVVPKAQVSISNEKTGITRTAEADEQGIYRVPALLPGVYTVELEANGFKRTEQTGIELRINETLRVDITLQVGDVNQVVAVSATAPLLQTESGTVGHVINNRQVIELPLNGRDFTQLTLLIPGSSPGSQAGGGFLVIGGNNVAVTGNRSDSNNYTLDGVDNNENFFKFHGLKPSIDAIEEFKIQTDITSAQFGNAAGPTSMLPPSREQMNFTGRCFISFEMIP